MCFSSLQSLIVLLFVVEYVCILKTKNNEKKNFTQILLAISALKRDYYHHHPNDDDHQTNDFSVFCFPLNIMRIASEYLMVIIIESNDQ